MARYLPAGGQIDASRPAEAVGRSAFSGDLPFAARVGACREPQALLGP